MKYYAKSITATTLGIIVVAPAKSASIIYFNLTESRRGPQ